MPGVSPRMDLALLPEDSNTQSISQPRQPENLPGLLRYAMDASNSGVNSGFTPAPLEDERKQFLENALKSMTVNVCEVMDHQIQILKDMPEDLTETQLEEKLQAFLTLSDLIDNIDFAGDFHKIGGFAIFNHCLECSQGKIRAATCDLIAELAQNNPYIQKAVCDEEFIPTILSVLQNDHDEDVQIKAVYALSCITRDYPEGYNLCIENNGVNILKNVILKDNDKLRTKVCFMLSSLYFLDNTLLDCLVEVGFLPILVKIIEGDWRVSNEHILALLTLLVENVPQAKTELRQVEYDFEYIIKKYLKTNLEDKEEEEAYCKRLKEMLFRN